MDKYELENHIAPLITTADTDEYAKRFDNFMYGLMLANIGNLPTMNYLKKQLCKTAVLPERKATIPKIINHIENNDYIEDIKILMKPPFDKPYSFIKMFDAKTRNAILQTIENIKNNALQVVA